MTTLTPRLEIASRMAQGMLARDGDEPAWITARRALEVADAMLADSQTGADASEMARTIQRLEGQLADVFQKCYEHFRFTGNEAFREIAAVAKLEAAK